MNDKTLVLNKEVDELELARQHKLAYLFIKRTFDIIVGLIGILFLLPLAIIIKIAYMLTGDNAPILFKQARIGKDGKTIYIYKFRSMIPNADKELERLMKKDKKIRDEYTKYKKLSNDPRITKIGKIIRHASIDEFPQFINVLKGEMSLIGPRPYLHREQAEMGEYFNKIVAVKPGLTGYWQVRGRSDTDFKTRLEMDEYYALNSHLEMDIIIFFKTFVTVLGRHGAK